MIILGTVRHMHTRSMKFHMAHMAHMAHMYVFKNENSLGILSMLAHVEKLSATCIQEPWHVHPSRLAFWGH